MNASLLGAAVALVRAWTWLYTSGMQPQPRDRRRAEVESDLWEFQRDAARERALSLPRSLRSPR